MSGTAIPPEIAANVRYWLRLLKKSGMRLLLSAYGYKRTFVKLRYYPGGALEPPLLAHHSSATRTTSAMSAIAAQSGQSAGPRAGLFAFRAWIVSG